MPSSPVHNELPLLNALVPALSYLLPERAIRFLLRVYPSSGLQQLLDISDTMARRSQEIIDEKMEAFSKGDEEMVQRVGEGKDIMSILRTWASSSNLQASSAILAMLTLVHSQGKHGRFR